MKIYYVTGIVWDEKQAPTVHVDEICKGLIKLGHVVTLYVPSPRNSEFNRNYPIIGVPTFRTFLLFWYQIRLFSRLCSDLRANHPDIIYSRNNGLFFVPALVSRIFNIPLILEVNGRLIEEVSFEGTILSNILSKCGVFKIIETFNFKSASGLIAVKDGIKDYIVSVYGIDPGKTKVITNGVDISMFRPIPTPKAREETLLDSSALYIGYIGSFYDWQGLKHIVEAARLVCPQVPNAKFLILGAGSEANNLKALVSQYNLEKCVEIHSAVNHDRVPLYINSLDICLSYPDKFRGGATSPFKIYEYLACAKCVVMADIEGIREEFGDVVAYAPPESPHDLSSVLLALLNDSPKRSALGSAGRAWIEKGRTWEFAARQTADFCKLILGIP